MNMGGLHMTILELIVAFVSCIATIVLAVIAILTYLKK